MSRYYPGDTSMTEPETFEPAPFQAVSDPRQLKAVADPIRTRILHILAEREATNQQLASALDEPQAKVLHHVRVLLDAGLIRLVDQRIRGGNVEKYYRATARLYGFRPDPGDAAAFSGAVAVSGMESIAQELGASLKAWPDQPLYWEGRRTAMSPERLAEFNERMLALIAEYWSGPEGGVKAARDGEVMSLAAVMYRFPGSDE
jgi:DNA-binding transcriptional ArsR family regulator